MYHTHPENNFVNLKSSHVCKLKSNSIPRSAVERKQRRKRTKMCKKLESRLDNSLHLPHNSHTPPSSATLAPTEPTSEPILAAILAPNKNVPKTNNERLIYL